MSAELYDVIFRRELKDLINSVNARMSMGWDATGGISFANSFFMQSVVKSDKKVVVQPKKLDYEFLGKTMYMVRNGCHLIIDYVDIQWEYIKVADMNAETDFKLNFTEIDWDKCEFYDKKNQRLTVS